MADNTSKVEDTKQTPPSSGAQDGGATAVKDKPEPSSTQGDTGAKKLSVKERLKKRAEEANVAAATKQMERMNMFDATKVSEIGSKRVGEKTVRREEGTFMVSGRNIGAGQTEPEWTTEQLEMIKNMSAFELEVVDVEDTRVSRPDPDGNFIGRDEEGTVVSMPNGYLSELDPTMYKLGAGQMKTGFTGGPGIYVDVVVIAKDETWMVNQPTSSFVVVDGVAESILSNPPKAGSKNSRRIGHDFARVGLPKFAFGPMFNTLEKNFPGILSRVKQSTGYYWLNASWGVSMIKGTYIYKKEDGTAAKTQLLSEVLRMIKGKSSLAIATVAISISFKAKRDGENWVPIMETAGLSVKLHNAVHLSDVDYHGPSQTGSSGMIVSKSVIDSLKPIRKPMTMGGSGSGLTARGLFSNIGKQQSGTGTQATTVADNDIM